jgi:twitching motility protein PilT
MAAALRLVPNEIKTIEDLNIPPHVLQFAEQKQGFVLAAGPTGHGKSTTLAALIDHINNYRSEHILTIEDPIEYQFTDKKSIVDQRELGRDADSFAKAIRATLRQDPNVILIGELRDLESMQTALTLAETGHLVFSTVHTNDAAQTISRIIDSFPANQQPQIRSQLANVLTGVISQRLLPWTKGGLIPAVEIMVASTAIRNAVREDKIHQIIGIMQTSSDLGMQTLDASIQALVDAGAVSSEEARPYMLVDKAAVTESKQ